MAYSAAGTRNINLTAKQFSTFEEFYDLVAGRCAGATLHVTPDQAKTIYHLMACTTDTVWQEPNLVPEDYRIGCIRGLVVVED